MTLVDTVVNSHTDKCEALSYKSTITRVEILTNEWEVLTNEPLKKRKNYIL